MPPGRYSPASERVPLILRRLRRAYPDARIALDYTTPLECVVATILSAQSTDVGVNKVTKSLFARYRTPEDYLAAPEEQLQREIHATGFWRQKTNALKGMAQRLVDDFDSQVPRTMKELMTLPGVARKTANIIQGNCYPEAAKKDPDAGMAVDTHVGRLAVRLGLTPHTSKDAVRIERDLIELIPKHRRLEASNLFIEHGRRICLAKSPRCEDCVIEPLCPSSQEAGLPDLYRAAPRRKSPTAPTMGG
jgi:endonuclease III